MAHRRQGKTGKTLNDVLFRGGWVKSGRTKGHRHQYVLSVFCVPDIEILLFESAPRCYEVNRIPSVLKMENGPPGELTGPLLQSPTWGRAEPVWNPDLPNLKARVCSLPPAGSQVPAGFPGIWPRQVSSHFSGAVSSSGEPTGLEAHRLSPARSGG